MQSRHGGGTRTPPPSAELAVASHEQYAIRGVARSTRETLEGDSVFYSQWLMTGPAPSCVTEVPRLRAALSMCRLCVCFVWNVR